VKLLLGDSYLQQKNVQRSSKYQEMQAIRKKLPAHSEKNKILSAVRNNQVVVICGETGVALPQVPVAHVLLFFLMSGCGKTTQVPQFILDEMIDAGCGGECSIICTQPRRLAAIGVGERVAAERAER